MPRLEYVVEHRARMAGESAYLSGAVCDLAECEARCAESFGFAERYPTRGYAVFASFVKGWNDMADAFERYGFKLEDMAA
jgi:hypothetical protein